MYVLLHGLHLTLVLGGAALVACLARPSASRTWRTRQLRAAARAGRLDALAAARIRNTGTFARLRRPWGVTILYGYSFGLACTAVAAASARLAGAPWPSWPVLAVVATCAWAIGVALFARRRRPRRVALIAIGAQVAAHPIVVVAASLAAHRRLGSLTQSLTAALFCHRVGAPPSTAQVLSAARGAGLRLPAATSASVGGFLSPAATLGAASLLAAIGLFAHYLCLDSPTSAWRGPRAGTVVGA